MKAEILIKYKCIFSSLIPYPYKGWLSGLRRQFAKLLYKVIVSRVRIPFPVTGYYTLFNKNINNKYIMNIYKYIKIIYLDKSTMFTNFILEPKY